LNVEKVKQEQTVNWIQQILPGHSDAGKIHLQLRYIPSMHVSSPMNDITANHT